MIRVSIKNDFEVLFRTVVAQRGLDSYAATHEELCSELRTILREEHARNKAKAPVKRADLPGQISLLERLP